MSGFGRPKKMGRMFVVRPRCTQKIKPKEGAKLRFFLVLADFFLFAILVTGLSQAKNYDL